MWPPDRAKGLFRQYPLFLWVCGFTFCYIAVLYHIFTIPGAKHFVISLYQEFRNIDTVYGSMLINKQKDANINIDIDGNKVSYYQNIKLLGVNIDSQLTFNDHISEICKKVSQRVGVMTRLRNLIPTPAKLQLYKAAVLPYLTYCSTACIFVVEVTQGRWSVSRRGVLGQFSVTGTLTISSCWNGLIYEP